MANVRPEAAYLEILDDIAKADGEPEHTCITEPAVRPPIYSVRYPDRPDPGSSLCFTVGLSSVPNRGWKEGQGPELAMRIWSLERWWGLALAEVARQGRGRRAFAVNVSIDFGDLMSPDSAMSAFLLIEPVDFPAHPLHCGERHIVLLQAVPLHASELEKVRRDGPEWLLALGIDLADPHRPAAV